MFILRGFCGDEESLTTSLPSLTDSVLEVLIPVESLISSLGRLNCTPTKMAAPRNPPFRAEHMGSLLRPAELLKIRAEFEAGECSYEVLKPVEDAAVKQIVDLETSIGIRSITDGEYR